MNPYLVLPCGSSLTVQNRSCRPDPVSLSGFGLAFRIRSYFPDPDLPSRCGLTNCSRSFQPEMVLQSGFGLTIQIWSYHPVLQSKSGLSVLPSGSSLNTGNQIWSKNISKLISIIIFHCKFKFKEAKIINSE